MSHEITLCESIMWDLSKVAFSCPARSEVAVVGDTQQARNRQASTTQHAPR